MKPWIHVAFLVLATLFATWLVGANLPLMWELAVEGSPYAWRLAGAAALVPVLGVAIAWTCWRLRRPWLAWGVTIGWIALQVSGLPWNFIR